MKSPSWKAMIRQLPFWYRFVNEKMENEIFHEQLEGRSSNIFFFSQILLFINTQNMMYIVYCSRALGTSSTPRNRGRNSSVSLSVNPFSSASFAMLLPSSFVQAIWRNVVTRFHNLCVSAFDSFRYTLSKMVGAFSQTIISDALVAHHKTFCHLMAASHFFLAVKMLPVDKTVLSFVSRKTREWASRPFEMKEIRSIFGAFGVKLFFTALLATATGWNGKDKTGTEKISMK